MVFMVSMGSPDPTSREREDPVPKVLTFIVTCTSGLTRDLSILCMQTTTRDQDDTVQYRGSLQPIRPLSFKINRGRSVQRNSNGSEFPCHSLSGFGISLLLCTLPSLLCSFGQFCFVPESKALSGRNDHVRWIRCPTA
jgi:hypothetical protein